MPPSLPSSPSPGPHRLETEGPLGFHIRSKQKFKVESSSKIRDQNFRLCLHFWKSTSSHFQCFVLPLTPTGDLVCHANRDTQVKGGALSTQAGKGRVVSTSIPHVSSAHVPSSEGVSAACVRASPRDHRCSRVLNSLDIPLGPQHMSRWSLALLKDVGLGRVP